jgi:RNA polymerase sigma-70 factor (ECF subfamily)
MPAGYDHIPDQQLLDRFHQTGDNHWLGVLLERYTLLLFGVCMKYLKNEEEARDAVQQIFLKALTELPRYRVTYVKSWLYTVARNHCLMKLRDRPKQPAEIQEYMPLAAEDEEGDRLAHLMKDRQFDLMEEALAELAPEQRTCVEQFYLDKKTYQQIAEKTGFNYMQVKSYIQNGKRNLKILLLKKLGKS